MRHKHLAFQCEYNEDETLASYAKGNYDFYDGEQIEEFVAFKGAYEITFFLKILMMRLTNLRALLYFSIALKIKIKNIISLIILRDSLPQRKRLMFCRTLWKKKLLKLKAPWMKKRRRVTNKRRKNGDIHVYLLMRVTL